MRYRFSSKNRGATLTEYAIILAIILAVLIPVFFLLGNNLFGSFDSMYKTLTGDSNSNTSLLSDNQPNTTPSGTTNINVGGLPISGVQKDFSEIIETSGSSAATEHLASLIDQIAKQGENTGLLSDTDLKLIRQLANLSYQLAHEEKRIESVSSGAVSVYNQTVNSLCEDDYINLNQAAQNDYFSSQFSSFTTYVNDPNNLNKMANGMYQISSGCYSNPDTLPIDITFNATNDRIRDKFDCILDEINSSTTLNPELMGMVNVLGNDIQLLADNMYNAYNSSSVVSSSHHNNPTYGTDIANFSNFFSTLAQANDGLTSEQTNLEAQLIDLLENNQIDANEADINEQASDANE